MKKGQLIFTAPYGSQTSDQIDKLQANLHTSQGAFIKGKR